MDGSTIWIGDKECGTIDMNDALPTDGTAMYVNVACTTCSDITKLPQDCTAFDEGVTGGAVTISKPDEGFLALCDIVVYKGERFPITLPEIIG